jgi:signal transduction histidine kinase
MERAVNHVEDWTSVRKDTLVKKEIDKILDSARSSVQLAASELDRYRIKTNNEYQNISYLFRQTPELFCMFSGPDHIFEIVNQAHILVLGFNATGMAVREAQPESVQVHQVLDEVYRTGKNINLREFQVTVTDRLRFFDLTFAARRDVNGEVNGIMCLGSEVTERVLSRKRIEAYIDDLKNMHRQLEESQRLREHYTNTLTHDLRTPLAAARMSAQLLLRHNHESEGRERLLLRIIDAVDRTDGMIGDLLDSNRIRAGERLPIKIDFCDLKSFIERSLEEHAMSHGKRFVFQCDGPVHGYWSCESLRRVLDNLITNAVKYGAADTPITVTLVGTEDTVRISIHNCGSEISPEDMDELFKMFRRSKQADSGEKRGWGIGLTLVKGLVEAHHGRVWVESTKKDGTVFHIDLPRDSRENPH